jgi:cytochrome c-type biogenesis protein CcmH/NrfF
VLNLNRNVLGLKRMLQAVLVASLAVAMLGADGTTSRSRYDRIGHNMMCVCSCSQVLLECNHVGCPDSERMIGELRDQLSGPNAAGADSLILNWFVNKYGAIVLAAPIRGGFDNVAWIIPMAAFLLGTLGTAYVVRSWAQKRQPAYAGATQPAPLDDSVRDRIRRESEGL